MGGVSVSEQSARAVRGQSESAAEAGPWHALANVARWAPSVHNTQAWRVRPIDATHAELAYMPERLLYRTDANGMFYTIGMGIFVEALDIAAGATGQAIEVLDAIPALDSQSRKRGPAILAPGAGSADDAPSFSPELLRSRRTSRIRYDGVSITSGEAEALTPVAPGQSVGFTSEPEVVRWVVNLNIDTLFHDLRHAPAREEIGIWIRKSGREARERRDGFSPRCIGFNGRLLAGFFNHHRLFDQPFIRQVIRAAYARSYGGTASVGWITGPMEAPAGRLRRGACCCDSGSRRLGSASSSNRSAPLSRIPRRMRSWKSDCPAKQTATSRGCCSASATAPHRHAASGCPLRRLSCERTDTLVAHLWRPHRPSTGADHASALAGADTLRAYIRPAPGAGALAHRRMAAGQAAGVARQSPAYRQLLSEHPGAKVEFHGLAPDFSRLPITDKAGYVLRFSVEERCRGGKLPGRGVTIDESSGTGGTPNNWVRGIEERADMRLMLQSSGRVLLGDAPIFVINAFALGPWATGMTISMSLADAAIVKSTGPEISKIENTLKLFGPGYRYLSAATRPS